jgi:hypothetical protein
VLQDEKCGNREMQFGSRFSLCEMIVTVSVSAVSKFYDSQIFIQSCIFYTKDKRV